MKGNESSITYLTRAHEYATTLANTGEPTKYKDLVMLSISGLRDEYNGMESNHPVCSPLIAFNEFHDLLSDHDFMINKSSSTSVSTH